MKVKMTNVYGDEGRIAYFRKDGDGCFQFTWDRARASELNEGEVASLMKYKSSYLKTYNGTAFEVEFSEDRDIEDKWFEIWYADKVGVIATMHHNLAADLDVGYDPLGKSITEQRKVIREYENNFDIELKNIREMKDKQHVEHWCYYDLKRRGAID